MEKLSLWDRFFNRYKKVIVEEGSEIWSKRYPDGYYYEGQKVPNSEYEKYFVKYKIIDRVTGSETIEKEYLN